MAEIKVNVTINGEVDVDKIAEQIRKEIEKATAPTRYRRVTDRKLKIGDFVKFADDTYDVTAGKYYEVKSVDEDGDGEIIDDVDAEFNLYGEEFEVYEKVSTGKAQTPFKTGDTVKATSKNAWVAKGTIGKILENDGSNHMPLKVEFNGEEDYLWVNVNEIEKIEKVSEPEPLKEVKLKVGDYAKVVKLATPSYGAKIGDIVKLISVAELYGGFKTEDLNGGNFNGNPSANAECFVRATDEEVAEAKAKLAEQEVATKWAAINRKPNEFKKGDIVEFSDDYTDIGVVEDIGGGRDETDILGVRTKREEDSYQAPKIRNVKLIAPVEARFDEVRFDRE